MAFYSLIKKACARAPEAPALLAPGRPVMTYADLERQIEAVIDALSHFGIARGERVAFALPNGPEMAAALLSLACVAACAPLNPQQELNEFSSAFERLRIDALIVLAGDRTAAREAALRHRVRILELVPSVGPAGSFTLTGRRRARVATQLARRQDDLMLVLQTSGTVSRPKVIPLTQGNVAASIDHVGRALGLRPGDRCLDVMPLFHIHGIVGGLFSSIGVGASVFCPPEFSELRFLDWLSESRATWYTAVPAIHRKVLSKAEEAGKPAHALRFIRSASAPLPPALAEGLETVFDVPVIDTYGMTEAAQQIASNPLPPGVRKRGAVGKAAGPEVAIMDADGSLLAAGRTGEVVIRGKNVMRGYEADAEANAAAWSRGWLRTGDAGYLDEDGYLFLVGRIKELINRAGEKVSPFEVEEALLRHPAVAEAAVFAIPDPELGEDVSAAVVLRKPGAATAAEILGALDGRLAHFKRPHRLEIVEQLPKGPTGKLQRAALSKAFARGTADVVAVTRLARTPGGIRGGEKAAALRRAVVEQLARVLGKPASEIRPDTPLMDMDSLRAHQLRNALEVELGVLLPATLAWGGGSIDDVVAAVASRLGVALEEPAGGAAPRSAGGAGDAIAVIGIGCRFPGAPSVEGYWALLKNGVDALTDPSPRRELAARGGFLDAVDLFDAGFFAISPREADRMDPQQRLLLEVAVESFEDAGLPLERVAGTATGAFVGIQNYDYAFLSLRGGAPADIYSYTGSQLSVAAGRLCHAFNLKGPALAVDTACSSSLVAVHLACQALRRGEAALALAAGVHVMASPLPSAAFATSGAVSPDGRCRTFDARANGTVRSEGCGVLVLKRLSDALRDGDRVRAVIRGSAMNHDGRAASFTAPNRRAQEDVYRAALRDAAADAGEVEFVETHGTGTALGDPVEVESLAAVYGRAQAGAARCLLGAVKTNIGHAVSAAGMAGLIKAILSLENGEIVRNLHFASLNPHINLEGTRLALPLENVPWPRRDRPRLAAVSSFGISGTNAHVIVEEGVAPSSPAVTTAETAARGPQLLVLSAREPAGLTALASSFRRALEAASGTGLADACYTAAWRRTRHEHRLCAAFSSREELLERLDAFTRSGEVSGLATAKARAPGKLVFVFCGQGPQRPGMGRGLFESEPVFRAVIEECDAALRGLAGWSLVDELRAPRNVSRMSEATVAQPALVALQLGLAALWKSRGVEPDAVIGHSLGEAAAARAAGALTLEQAMRLAFLRAESALRAAGLGRSVAVGLSEKQARDWLSAYGGVLTVAAVNGPESTLVSGDKAAAERLAAELAKEGVFARMLETDFAFHSPQMEASRRDLVQRLAGFSSGSPSLPFFSTVTGGRVEGPGLDATYWGRNMREPVLFWPAIERLIDQDHDVFIELGPHPVLAPYLREGLAKRGRDGAVLASLRRDSDEDPSMLQALAAYGARARGEFWSRRYPSGRLVSLPGYPWQRRRHWLDSAEAAPPVPPSPAPAASAPAEESGLRAHLVTTVALLLGRAAAELDVDAPLPSLGFDSMMAWQLKSDVETRFKVSVSAIRLLEPVSIRQLAAELEASRSGGVR